MTVALLAVLAFVLGFVIGDSRGAKQCNRTLDRHLGDLQRLMLQDEPHPASVDEIDDVTRPTVH